MLCCGSLVIIFVAFWFLIATSLFVGAEAHLLNYRGKDLKNCSCVLRCRSSGLTVLPNVSVLTGLPEMPAWMRKTRTCTSSNSGSSWHRRRLRSWRRFCGHSRLTCSQMALERAHYSIEGQAISNVFSLRFSGASGLAAARVSKFLQLQHTGGVWRELAAKDSSGTSHRLYISCDKNLRQVRTEAIVRRFHKLFKTWHPDLDFFCKKRDGQICSKLDPPGGSHCQQ